MNQVTKLAAFAVCTLMLSAPAAQAEEGDSHLGGCILKAPVTPPPEDLYALTDVTPTDSYPPFVKELTAAGLTLVARDDISDEFMVLVGNTIDEIFTPGEETDTTKQAKVIAAQYAYNALIPVPHFEQQDEIEAMMEDASDVMRTNSVCDIIMTGSPGQVMEVIEHILHYVSDIGLHYAFPEAWGISADSALAVAMDQAIEGGDYKVGKYYEDGFRTDETLRRVLMQEFAYWFISTAWDLQTAYGPIEDEWTLRSPELLKEKMPEFYAVYEATAAKVMTPPSQATLDKIGPTLR